MLTLNAHQIKSCVTPQHMIEAMEMAMHWQAQEAVLMPDRMHIAMQENTLLLMPCIGKERFCTKVVSVFPNNKNWQQDSIYGNVLLNDGKTGKSLALLEGKTVTALRTGAMGALAVKYLSPTSSSTLGIIGTGVQGLHQAWMITNVRKLDTIFIFNYHIKKTENFIQELKTLVKEVKIEMVPTIEDLLQQSEIIVTATSSSEAVLPDDINLLKNKYFIGVGSFKPTMQEFPNALFSLIDQYFVDTLFAKKESGDVLNPLQNGWLREHQIIPLSAIITGQVKVKGTTQAFKSVGMALLDLAAASTIYDHAIQKNIGIKLDWI